MDTQVSGVVGDLVVIDTPPCMGCGMRSSVAVKLAEFRRWKDGALIQHAFPSLSKDERELLQTGTHPQCWDELFNEEEEE